MLSSHFQFTIHLEVRPCLPHSPSASDPPTRWTESDHTTCACRGHESRPDLTIATLSVPAYRSRRWSRCREFNTVWRVSTSVFVIIGITSRQLYSNCTGCQLRLECSSSCVHSCTVFTTVKLVISCEFSILSLASPSDPHRGSALGPRWRTFVPRRPVPLLLYENPGSATAYK